MKSQDNIGYSNLTIKGSQKSDQGAYICIVQDHANNTNNVTHFVKVLDPHDSHIEMKEENDVYKLEYPLFYDPTATSVQWKINIQAHPKINKIEWINNRNMTIGNSTKYMTTWNGKETLLKINEIDINDFGDYTLVAANKLTEKKLEVRLIVKGSFF